MDEAVLKRAAAIEMVVFDVDGVFTDGRFYYGPDDIELKAFHTRDGHGIKRLHAAGIRTAVISGRESVAVTRRMRELHVGDIIQNRSDKLPVFEELLARHHIEAAHCAAVGDDLPDLPLLEAAGFAVAVADAHPDIRSAAHWVTPTPGGHGAVRDVADLLLAAR
ncbi:MAG TPA: HAD-IIIA family hydrolase [Gammaproteobacteria bacterium]|nr:HAD-IIIA family hydrolase [Gammaproteobacteria bacterium]